MVTTGDDPVQMLVVGAARGVAYESQLYTELGGCCAVLASPASPVVAGEPVLLDASRSHGVARDSDLSFEWLPDGAGELVQGDAFLTHVYQRPGTYRAIVNVTTNNGRWDAASTLVTVLPST